MDVKIKLGQSLFDSQHKVDISALLTDLIGKEIDNITASATGNVTFGRYNFAQAWRAAMVAFGGNLSGSSKPRAFASGIPAIAAANLVASGGNAFELAFWDSVKGSSNPADFQSYLQKFPNGSFASLARTRLTSMGEALPTRTTALPMR